MPKLLALSDEYPLSLDLQNLLYRRLQQLLNATDPNATRAELKAARREALSVLADVGYNSRQGVLFAARAQARFDS